MALNLKVICTASPDLKCPMPWTSRTLNSLLIAGWAFTDTTSLARSALIFKLCTSCLLLYRYQRMPCVSSFHQHRVDALPLQKTIFVVSSGKECRRLNLIWVPNLEKVPVPVLSSLNAPFSMTSSTISKYCTMHSACQHCHSSPIGFGRACLMAFPDSAKLACQMQVKFESSNGTSIASLPVKAFQKRANSFSCWHPCLFYTSLTYIDQKHWQLSAVLCKSSAGIVLEHLQDCEPVESQEITPETPRVGCSLPLAASAQLPPLQLCNNGKSSARLCISWESWQTRAAICWSPRLGKTCHTVCLPGFLSCGWLSILAAELPPYKPEDTLCLNTGVFCQKRFVSIRQEEFVIIGC